MLCDSGGFAWCPSHSQLSSMTYIPSLVPRDFYVMYALYALSRPRPRVSAIVRSTAVRRCMYLQNRYRDACTFKIGTDKVLSFASNILANSAFGPRKTSLGLRMSGLV